jgi:hypothetical protein
VDYNADGKIDLIAGDTKGQVWLFLNVGTAKQPKLAKGTRVEAAGKPIVGGQKVYKRIDGKFKVDRVVPGNHELSEKYSKLHMADWNADGLPDLLIGQNPTMVWYRNVGTKSEPKFTEPEKIVPEEGRFPSRPSPYVIDWDGDGKKDLLVGSERPQVFFFRNVGTSEEPKLAKGVDLKLSGEGFNGSVRLRFDVTDWDGDGILDILAGNFHSTRRGGPGGNVWFFRGQ